MNKVKYKREVYKKLAHKVDMTPTQALEELICVNVPKVQIVIENLKNFLRDDSYLVDINDTPLILWLKTENIGSNDDEIHQWVLCFYHLPWLSLTNLSLIAIASSVNTKNGSSLIKIKEQSIQHDKTTECINACIKLERMNI